MANGWLASPGLTPTQAADGLNRYRQACAEHSTETTATAIRRDIFVGASDAHARRVVGPYIDTGYRGINPDALIYGSVQSVAEQLRVLQKIGFTDVIVRNLSGDQSEALATIERLADVKALLA